MGDNRGRDDSRLRVFSWNVGGLRAQHVPNFQGSRFGFFERVLKIRKYPHIVAIQETHLTDREMLEIWERSLENYKCYFTYGEVRTKGTAILIRKDVPMKIQFVNLGGNGRFTLIKGDLGGNLITLVSIYAPLTKQEKVEFFEDIINENLEGLIYLMGDFNSVANGELDADPARRRDEEFVEFMNTGSFYDIWRENNPDREGVSCRSGQNWNRRSRIDYILTSRIAKETVSNINYIWWGLSDHHVIEFELNFEEVFWGRDFKKFKPTIFKDENYEKIFENIWEYEIEGFRKKVKSKIRLGIFVGDAIAATNMIDGSYKNWNLDLLLPNLDLDHSWWDNFKEKIKKSAILWQKLYANKRKKFLDHLIYLYQTTRYQAARNKLEIDIANEVKKLNREILFESHCQERVYHEKCSAPFFRKMRKKRDDAFIFEYTKENGQITRNKEEIKNEMKNSYENLYKNVPMIDTYLEKFLNNIVLPQVQDLNDNCLTFEELFSSLKETQANKCPGLDGIPIDFYKKYFHVFGNFFTKMANNCFETNNIPESWKTSLLRLIPKTENEIPSFKNMRPLTMINVDAKLITKSLGNRMGDVMPKIIGDRQTGGVKGRQVQKNTALINFFIWHLYEQHKNGFICSLDNQKAFDSVKRDFLWLVLEKFGFSIRFINMIKTMYQDSTAVLSINGFFTERFAIEMGVKQGCSMSPILYTLFIEPLAIAIENEITINGLIAPNRRVLKILQHSDDMTLFTPNTRSLRIALNLINNYKDLSGAKINYDKSFIIQINSINCRKLGKFGPIKVKKSYEYGKILGIYFSDQPYVAKQHNWLQVYSKCENELKSWNARELSVVGRVLVLNTLITSKLNYVMESLGMIKEFSERFKKLYDTFLWPAGGPTRKAVKIKQNALTWPKEKGGMNLVYIEDKQKSLYFKWFKKFINRDFETQEQKEEFLQDYNLSFLIYYLERAYRCRISNNLISFPEINYAYVGRNIHLILQHNWIFSEIFEYFQRFNFLMQNHPRLTVHGNTKLAYSVLSQQRYVDQSGHYDAYFLRYYAQKHRVFITIDQFKSLARQFYLPCLDTKIQSFNILTVWNVLPTNSRMHEQNLALGRDENCSYCRRGGNGEFSENFSHIFRKCEIAVTVWNRINTALTLAGEETVSLDWKDLTFKWHMSHSRVLLISEVMFALWKNRNANTYQDVSQNAFAVLPEIKYKLNLLSAIDRKNPNITNQFYNIFWGGLNKLLTELKTVP